LELSGTRGVPFRSKLSDTTDRLKPGHRALLWPGATKSHFSPPNHTGCLDPPGGGFWWAADLLAGHFVGPPVDFPSPAIMVPISDLHFVQSSQPAVGMRGASRLVRGQNLSRPGRRVGPPILQRLLVVVGRCECSYLVWDALGENLHPARKNTKRETHVKGYLP
jgi:hypothetical protein